MAFPTKEQVQEAAGQFIDVVDIFTDETSDLQQVIQLVTELSQAGMAGWNLFDDVPQNKKGVIGAHFGVALAQCLLDKFVPLCEECVVDIEPVA